MDAATWKRAAGRAPLFRHGRSSEVCSGAGFPQSLAGGGKNSFDVTGNLDLSPGLCNSTGLIDEKRRALDPHILPPVHAFLDPDSERLASGPILVGGQDDAKFMLVTKLCVLCQRIL